MGRVTAATDLTLLSIVLLALVGFAAALLWLAARLVPMDIRMVPGLSVAFTCIPANISQSCFAGWCLDLLLSAPAYQPALSQQCFDGPHKHSHGAWNGCRLHLHTSQQSASHALLVLGRERSHGAWTLCCLHLHTSQQSVSHALQHRQDWLTGGGVLLQAAETGARQHLHCAWALCHTHNIAATL